MAGRYDGGRGGGGFRRGSRSARVHVDDVDVRAEDEDRACAGQADLEGFEPEASAGQGVVLAVGFAQGIEGGGALGALLGSATGPLAIAGVPSGATTGASIGVVKGAAISAALGGMLDMGLHMLSERSDAFGNKNPQEQYTGSRS